MVNRTVGIPAALARRIEQGGRGVATRLRQLALRELEGVGPLPPPPLDDLRYVPVTIDAPFEEALQRARSRMPGGSDWSDAQVIAALALAADNHPVPDEAPEAPDLTVSVLHSLAGLVPRPEQLVLAELVDRALHNSRIALLEAATGSGKGLVLAAAAVAAAERGQRVAIAAPTHQINRQTLKHLEQDLGERVAALGGVAVLIGRSGFISAPALIQVLEDRERIDEETRAVATAWLMDQRRRYASGERADLYRADLLAKLCPRLPRDEVYLRAYERDEAAECYDAQFRRAAQAPIVLVTHAMLATLTRQDYLARRREVQPEEDDFWRDTNARLAEDGEGVLGSVKVLLIDEAHVLEQSVAGALSEVLSLRALARRCRRLCETLPSAAGIAAEVDDAVAALANIDERSFDEAAAGPALSEVVRLHGGLQAILRRFSGDGKVGSPPPASPELRGILDELRRQESALRFGLNEPAGRVIHLRHSPDRRYPQLTVGPRSVRRQLDFLWQRVQSAALLSATLYTQTMAGVPSCAAVAARLQIDPLRLLSHLPVVPEWLTQPVTLHLPAPTSVAWRPPAADADDAEKQAYFEALSVAVSRFCSDARGGSLVLCTSHEAVGALAAGWRGDASRRVIQSRDEPFPVTLRRFAGMALSGARPVWFATGQAWTGLDIYSGLEDGGVPPPPAEDWMLTHLVIPRLPFDLQTTSTELARRQHRQDTQWLSVVQDCQMMLRQGMGRLVRRQGLRDRHIAVLDPRGVSPAFKGMSSIRSLWLRYPNQRELVEGEALPPPAPPEVKKSPTLRRIVFD